MLGGGNKERDRRRLRKERYEEAKKINEANLTNNVNGKSNKETMNKFNGNDYIINYLLP